MCVCEWGRSMQSNMTQSFGTNSFTNWTDLDMRTVNFIGKTAHTMHKSMYEFVPQENHSHHNNKITCLFLTLFYYSSKLKCFINTGFAHMHCSNFHSMSMKFTETYEIPFFVFISRKNMYNSTNYKMSLLTNQNRDQNSDQKNTSNKYFHS